MSYKIKIKENNKIKKINVVKLINQYERLIYKICIKWVQSFSFDRSIEIDDLVQELKIKYLHDLKSQWVHQVHHLLRHQEGIQNIVQVLIQYQTLKNILMVKKIFKPISFDC